MERLIVKVGCWLKTEISDTQVPVAAILLAILVAIYMIPMNLLLLTNGIITAAHSSDLPLIKNNLPYFLSLLVLGAAWEEMVFRVPLVLVVRNPTLLTITFVLLSVVAFGWVHGSFWRVLSQGVAGGIFGLFFLKCGGMNDRWCKAWASSTLLHLTSNLILTGVIIVILWLQ